MGQLGFFDADKRLQALSARGDPLEAIDHLVPWESFRAEIEAVVLTPDELNKSSAGRKPFDAILMFRMLVLQALNNLSDEQVEYQVRDRLSFSRFLGLEIEDSIPDATTLWLFREKLAKAGLIEKLFDRFDNHAVTSEIRTGQRQELFFEVPISLVEEIAGVTDYEVALAAYWTVVERWPDAEITLRNRARRAHATPWDAVAAVIRSATCIGGLSSAGQLLKGPAPNCRHCTSESLGA